MPRVARIGSCRGWEFVRIPRSLRLCGGMGIGGLCGISCETPDWEITMRNAVRWLMVLGAIPCSLTFAPVVHAQENFVYARCNFKVHGGNEITWINWQASPTFIPVGTKLRVTRTGSKASVV